MSFSMCVHFLAVVYVMLCLFVQYFTFFRYKFSFLPECSYSHSPTHSFPSISNHFPVYLLKKEEGSFLGLMAGEEEYTEQQTANILND